MTKKISFKKITISLALLVAATASGPTLAWGWKPPPMPHFTCPTTALNAAGQAISFARTHLNQFESIYHAAAWAAYTRVHPNASQTEEAVVEWTSDKVMQLNPEYRSLVGAIEHSEQAYNALKRLPGC